MSVAEVDRGAGPPAHRLHRWPTLWAFSRPHTMLGTSLSLASLFAVVTLRWPWPEGTSPGLALVAMTWLAALAANVYIVGLNQLTDVEIDRVNKPKLPLASGAMSRREATRLVAFALVLSLSLGAMLGRWLLATLAVSSLIGMVYSLPPLRLKGSALGAPLCIALVRGPLVNLGLAMHLRALGPTGTGPGSLGDLPPEVWLLALFMTLSSLGIGIAKDLPDVEGDRAHAIANLAVRSGPGRAFQASTMLWAMAYLLTAGIGMAILPRFAALVLMGGHLVALFVLARAAGRVQTDDRAGVQAYYRLLWRLFYAEYLLMPLVAAIAARWS